MEQTRSLKPALKVGMSSWIAFATCSGGPATDLNAASSLEHWRLNLDGLSKSHQVIGPPTGSRSANRARLIDQSSG